MSKTDYKKASTEALINSLVSPFTDSWILMLALGGLHHIQGWHCNFNYWTCLLIIVIGVCILPQNWNTNAYLKKMLEKY